MYPARACRLPLASVPPPRVFSRGRFTAPKVRATAMSLKEQISLAVYIVIPIILIPWLIWKIHSLDHHHEDDHNGEEH